MQQTKFTYSLLGKAFEKQTKIIEDQKKTKKVDSLESLEFSEKNCHKKSLSIKRKAKS